MKLACEDAIKEGDFFVSASTIRKQTDPMGIPEEDVYDAIRVLDDTQFIEGLIEGGSHIEHFKVTLYGFHEYAKAYVPNLDGILTAVAAKIVNDGINRSTPIQESLGQPKVIIEYALGLLKNQGWIKTSGAIGSDIFIADPSPELKRQLL